MAERGDRQWMERALELAARARGRTSPNPMVGAVIVRDGAAVGEGYHAAAGRPHAEVAAIAEAGEAARGGCLYVTLEPCNHTGRTGPCTEAILEAGIARVVFATDDPNAMVSGGGARRLAEAGVAVERGVLADEAAELNEAFFGFHRNGRPWVVAKIAQTLDGRIATRTGDSKWISGPEARVLAHRLRADADAVVVGMGTVLADDPELTVRHVDGENPLRIVVTTSLDLPAGCRLMAANDDGKTVVATSRETAATILRRGLLRRVTVWEVAAEANGWISPAGLLDRAAREGVQSVLVEGGAALLTSFLHAGLVDKLVQVTAPKIIGEGLNGVGDLGVRSLDKALVFDRARFEPLGDDVVFTGYPRRSG